MAKLRDSLRDLASMVGTRAGRGNSGGGGSGGRRRARTAGAGAGAGAGARGGRSAAAAADPRHLDAKVAMLYEQLRQVQAGLQQG